VPAAAVIPAPIAYIKVVAVKKLVVGFLGVGRCRRPPGLRGSAPSHPSVNASGIELLVAGSDILP
jgi:hypothetical protein